VTLFGKSIFINVIKLRILRRDHPKSRTHLNPVGTKSNNKCPYKRDTQKRGGCSVIAVAKTGLMWPQTKEHLELSEVKEIGMQSSLEPPEGIQPCQCLDCRLLTS
jgi:hypothetical protein